MVSKSDMMDAGTLLVGAAAGAAVSRYGSNALSDALTKDDRAAGTSAKDISLFKKAPAMDIALGVAAGAVGIYAKTGKSVKLALTGAAAYLVANGALDMVGDLTADDADRQSNGRPLRKVDGVTVGAQARRMAMLRRQSFTGQRSPAGLQQVPMATVEKVALL